MIDVILDCGKEQELMIKHHLQSLLYINFIKYNEIKHDFILIKEIKDKDDLMVINKMNKLSFKFDLICLISNEKFILNLIDLHQAYFLNKEKLKTNIFVIDECIKNFESSKSQYIEIRSNYEQIILNIKRIVYVESYRHNVIIHTENGEFKSKKKLSELLNQIEYFDFIQIHKSYVVNEEFINSVSSKCVILNNLIELPLGRKYSKNVKKILLIKRRK